MTDKELKERVKQEIEAEAAALEQKIEGNPELDSLVMPEDSYEDLMQRVADREKAKKKAVRFSKRKLLVVALAAVLLIAVGAGASGAKLFVPVVENRELNSGFNIAIDNDDALYVDITEEEAYEEIEEKLGIQALRLGYKPDGMELETVYIDADMGEALMEFYYEEHILTIYESKQFDGASTNTQIDGEVIDNIELFYYGESLEITEIDQGDGKILWATQIEQGNAYYFMRSDIDLEQFENILCEILFMKV